MTLHYLGIVRLKKTSNPLSQVGGFNFSFA